MTDRRAWRSALLLIGLVTAVRVVFALGVPLFPDETYYWEWSRHLAPGYFDHPPAIALLIAGGTALWGDTAAGIRVGGVLAGLMASILLVDLARRMGGGPGALAAAAIFACLPLAAAGLVLATPDAPLMLGTALSIWAVIRALEAAPGSRRDLVWWAVAGLATGVALLSKLTALLIPLGIAVAFSMRPDLRRRFRTPGPWLACAVSVVVFLPFLLWNARNEWITFSFQLAHGLGDRDGSVLVRQLELIGGQMGLVSPVLFVLLARSCAKALRDIDSRRFVLAIIALTIFGVFVIGAFRAPVEPNWPAAAYVPAIVVLATARWTDASRRWFHRGLALGGIMVVGIYAQAALPWLPLPAPRDPVAHAFGWHQVASNVAREAAVLEAGGCPAVWLEARTYQHASEAAFNLPGTPYVHANNLMSRPNQYDTWAGFADLASPGDCLVLFGRDPGTTEAIRALAPAFRGVERAPRLIRTRGGEAVEELHVWRLRDWSGDASAFR